MQTEENHDYSGLRDLLNTEVLKNYNNSIVSIAMNNVKDVSQVIDFGAGVGTLSLLLREQYKINPICIEIDDVNKEYLSNRGFQFYEHLNSAPRNSDLIFSSNVLEHIEDDVRVLEMMRDNLKEGGKLYLYLPAKMILWTKLDENVGHYRRYEIAELREKCEQVGFKIKKIHFADCAGFFAALLMKYVGYNADSGIGSVKSLKFYDKWLFPISKFFDKLGFRYLFGKNIVLVAEK